MKFNINKVKGKTSVLRVRDAVKEGKSIYKNFRGCENDINEVLTDFSNTGLKDIIVCMNVLYPGKVNGEFKMTRGHFHNAEEVYLILSGKGYFMMGSKMLTVKKGNLITIPENVWHRTVNIGKDKLVFLTIFQKHEESHLKSY